MFRKRTQSSNPTPLASQTVENNYGTVQQQLLASGSLSRLNDVIISLDSLPADLRLKDPNNPDDPVGAFTGREWLIKDIDSFLKECVEKRTGRYLLVEAEAGMGKGTLAAFLAFRRRYPSHITGLRGGVSAPASAGKSGGAADTQMELDRCSR